MFIYKTTQRNQCNFSERTLSMFFSFYVAPLCNSKASKYSQKNKEIAKKSNVNYLCDLFMLNCIEHYAK